MDLFFIFMLAVGLSMAAFAVSISAGLCTLRNSDWNALKAALFFGVFQWESFSAGLAVLHSELL